MLVSLLTLGIGRRPLNLVRAIAPPTLSKRLTPLRWVEAFMASAPMLLERELRLAGVKKDPLDLTFYYMVEGADPHVGRQRLLAPWVR